MRKGEIIIGTLIVLIGSIAVLTKVGTHIGTVDNGHNTERVTELNKVSK